MHRLVSSAILLAITQLTTLPAWADSIKPGLWGINNKITSASAETDLTVSLLLGHLANLPPDQRKTLQAMAAQQGMTMPDIGPDGAIGLTSCVTPEMAARQQLPTGQPGDCTSKNVAVAGGIDVLFRCTNPPSNGEGKLRFIGDKNFVMKLNLTTRARGQPEQMQIDTDGTWLGASCAAARPQKE